MANLFAFWDCPAIFAFTEVQKQTSPDQTLRKKNIFASTLKICHLKKSAKLGSEFLSKKAISSVFEGQISFFCFS